MMSIVIFFLWFPFPARVWLVYAMLRVHHTLQQHGYIDLSIKGKPLPQEGIAKTEYEANDFHSVLCFVSLRVDLPTVWHGLGRWERGGIEQINFSCILSCFTHFCNHLFIGNFGRLPLGPILGVPHHLVGAQHSEWINSPPQTSSLEYWAQASLIYPIVAQAA